MYKPLSTLLIPLIFLISTFNTGASLIGIYGRIGPAYLWNTEGKKSSSLKNIGGHVNCGWQLSRTEEVDLELSWGSQDIGFSGSFPVISTSWKHLIALSHNVQMYLGGGLALRMREFKWNEKVIMPLGTLGFVYYYTPKISIEMFCKRYLVYDDSRLNQSPFINKVKGDIPVVGVRVGYYLF